MISVLIFTLVCMVVITFFVGQPRDGFEYFMFLLLVAALFALGYIFRFEIFNSVDWSFISTLPLW